MYLKIVRVALMALCVIATASAQKLPAKQEGSVAIPPNLKINGKADEWSNQFQAYNSATELKYTIANDDKKLYIIVRAEESNIVQKALLQGITISISPLTKNDSKVSVTYPLENGGKGVFMNPSVKWTDSLVKASNRRLTTQAKEMRITGIKNINDETTAIYNEYDIQIAAAIDADNTYTAELVIPLKYIDVTARAITTLKYDIQLNAPIVKSDPSVNISQSADGSMTRLSSVGNDGITRTVSIDTKTYSTMMLPLNFSGEYKLK